MRLLEHASRQQSHRRAGESEAQALHRHCPRGMGISVRKEIPDTSIFDLRLSRRGYRLNKMCAALCSPAQREAFKRDEEAFMARFGLTEGEKNLIRRRDFKGMIEHGMNIY